MNRFYGVCRFFIYGFTRTYFRMQLHGTENIPREGAVILAANHASNLDPTTITCGLRRQCHFLAKEELFRKPILGRFLRKVNANPINRAGVDRKALKVCADILNAGGMLLIFPEGTRTRDGELQEAKPGAAMIAMQTEAQIVPVYITGTMAAMGVGAGFPKPHKVDIWYGKPFLPEKADPANKREAYERLAKRMMDEIAKLKESAEVQGPERASTRPHRF